MAVVSEENIIQVVGYQNSGKTTTVVKLINDLKERNFNVVTIKHHGHGGKPDVLEKDSSLHCKAGSSATIVEGDGRLLLQAEQADWSLSSKIELCSYFKPDIILIEGHKHAQYPKIVLIRNKDDYHLLEQLKNIRAVFYWGEKIAHLTNVEQFNIKDENSWLLWFRNFTKSK